MKKLNEMWVNLSPNGRKASIALGVILGVVVVLSLIQ